MLNFNAEMNGFELSPEKIQRNFVMKELNEAQKSYIVSTICTIFDSIFDSYQKNLPFVFYALKEINDIIDDNTAGTRKFNQIFSDEFTNRSGRCAKSTRLSWTLERIFKYKFGEIEYFDRELNILKLNKKISAKKAINQETEIQNLMSYCLNEVVKQLPRTYIFKEQCRNYGLEILDGKNGVELHGIISISPSEEEKFADEKGIVSPVLRKQEVSGGQKRCVISDKKIDKGTNKRRRRGTKSGTKSGTKRTIGSRRKRNSDLSGKRKPNILKANTKVSLRRKNSSRNGETGSKKGAGSRRRFTNLQRKIQEFNKRNERTCVSKVKTSKCIHRRTNTI